jgi:hypothetical protein
VTLSSFPEIYGRRKNNLLLANSAGSRNVPCTPQRYPQPRLQLASQRIRYNGHMNWDKAWPLYTAAVVVPIATAIGLWLFGVWFGG